MNNILTSSTEPYDLSLSRSFQNLSHLPPSYELALKSDSCKSVAAVTCAGNAPLLPPAAPLTFSSRPHVLALRTFTMDLRYVY